MMMMPFLVFRTKENGEEIKRFLAPDVVAEMEKQDADALEAKRLNDEAFAKYQEERKNAATKSATT